MKILKLRVKNSIGIQKGLGLSEIDLDFSEISGLVALAGDNGKGKSTILEMLQPYSRMVSRKGSLQSHFYGRDGYKELEFSFHGDNYKSLIKIDAESSRTEGFLWKNAESLCDGKISNYNKLIIGLIGSPELFFNSVFCSQGAKNISDMTTGDLKKLFSEFLRLDKLTAHEDTAKQCNNLLTSRAASIERDIESLKILTDGYAEACILLSNTKADKKALELRLLELSHDLEKSEAELVAVQTDIQKNELIKTELDGLQKTQDRLSSEIEGDQKQSKIELDELRVKYKNFETAIANLDSLLSNKNKIEQAVTTKNELTKAIAVDRDTLEGAVSEHSIATQSVLKKEAELKASLLEYEKDLNEAENRRDQLILKIDHIVSQKLSEKEVETSDVSLRHTETITNVEKCINALEVKLESAKLSVKDLSNRDKALIKASEPKCKSKACPFITTALSAQQDIPGIEVRITEQAAHIAKIEKAYSCTLKQITADIEVLKSPAAKKTLKETQQLDIEINNMDNMERAHTDLSYRLNASMMALKGDESARKIEKKTIEARIKQAEDKLEGVNTLADELPKVETAFSRKQDLEKRQTENIADGKKTKDFWEKRIIEKKGQQFAALETIKEKKTKINIVAEEKVGDIKQSISDLKTSITKRTDEIADKIAEIIVHEQDVVRKEQAQKELTDKTTERELVVNEASEWAYLKDACSAKGLRALEIDSVLPAIAAYANDLLIRTFGTQYTVRFQTQDEETGREILDIIVIREDGSEVPIENLSGGQRVWLLSALRLSLTLISQEKSGKSFQTGFADESDGALDVGHAIEYVQMYRAFMKVGGFEDFLFISHKPETIALADHVLNFGNGKIAID